MKQAGNELKVVLVVVLMFFSGMGYAQSGVFKDIAYALESGNASDLASHFGNRIELTILEEEDVYSRRQAEIMVREFFKDHPPEGFEVIHEGSSNQNARYAIGSLSLNNGNSFRTYMFVKEESGSLRIKELRFETE